MKIDLLDIINNKGTTLDLTDEDLKKIKRDIVIQNIKRIRLIACILLVVEPCLVVFVDLPRFMNAAESDSWIYFSYIICHILLGIGCIPTIAFSIYLSKKSEKYIRYLNSIVSIFLTILGLSIFGYIDILDRMTSGVGMTYAIYFMIMCSVFLMSPPMNIIVLISPHIIYFILNLKIAGNTVVTVNNLINISAMVFTMLLFNCYIYYSYLNHLKKNYALKKKNEALNYLATHDQLTGLLNKSAFMQKITGVSKGTFVLIDLDHFKRINDGYSHLAGDQILLEFSKQLESTFENAVTARWGGEEFVAFFPKQTINSIYSQIESFREKLMKCEFIFEEQQILLTASFGIASLNDDYNETFRKADQALYQAKEGGRNKVVFYEEST